MLCYHVWHTVTYLFFCVLQILFAYVCMKVFVKDNNISLPVDARSSDELVPVAAWQGLVDLVLISDVLPTIAG